MLPYRRSKLFFIPGYKVVSELGQGTYGKVYKAQGYRDGRFYAIKEINISSVDVMEHRAAFLEAQLLKSISHVNVIACRDAFFHSSCMYIVMEYLQQGDLANHITQAKKKATPLPEELIWRLLLQLCYGLHALHSKRIIHRDIKPENIFLGERDIVKIGDLGIAKVVKEAMSFAAVGTPCFMAPEVWAGQAYSYSSDLWSLGVVLYEMMTLCCPFDGNTTAELRAKVLRGDFEHLVAGPYSEDLVAICHGLLVVDPTKRLSLAKLVNSDGAKRWRHVLVGTVSMRPASSPGGCHPAVGSVGAPRAAQPA